MNIKDRIEQAVQNPRNSESVRALLRDVLADRELMEEASYSASVAAKDAISIIKSLCNIYKLPHPLATLDKLAAISQQDKKE